MSQRIMTAMPPMGERQAEDLKVRADVRLEVGGANVFGSFCCTICLCGAFKKRRDFLTPTSRRDDMKISACQRQVLHAVQR